MAKRAKSSGATQASVGGPSFALTGLAAAAAMPAATKRKKMAILSLLTQTTICVKADMAMMKCLFGTPRSLILWPIRRRHKRAASLRKHAEWRDSARKRNVAAESLAAATLITSINQICLLLMYLIERALPRCLVRPPP